MGCFDSVRAPCPRCGARNEFQSKSGPCFLHVYDLADAPESVLADVNRHFPIECHKCQCRYQVNAATCTTFEGMTEDDRLMVARREARKVANHGKQIDNATLYAGSPMYYYCRDCGALVASLPECHTEAPPRYCEACYELRKREL
jgi:hypothetical protein